MTVLDADQMKVKTGDLGERLVARYFRSQGLHVEESIDLFDQKKDMIVDEKHTCEVKTQQLWHKENAFTIKPGQVAKCRDVDILIFVETPSKYNGNIVNLYEFPKDRRKTRIHRTRDGRTMHLFGKENARLLATISDPVIVDQFNRYTLSTWR
jgi:hypothetical protein